MDPATSRVPGTATPLPPLTQRLVLHWGEMGSRWGVNRTVSQVHALLYLAGRPLDAEEIADALQVARSNVSTSLRELASWRLVRVVHRMGDRRDHFTTAQDPWELFRTIVRERKAREFDPTVDVLRACLADPALVREPPMAQARMRETLALMESLSAWSEEMLTLQTPTLVKLMKLGARIAKLLHPDRKARAVSDMRAPVRTR
jgi:DNA-binding transcriptional regulator GbsR (MarR family)